MARNTDKSALAALIDGFLATLSVNKYLLIMAGAALSVLGGISAVNFYIDPLWYYSGNTLTGKNYVLDERASKPTRLARLDSKPDCLLFGTSSGSLMNHGDRIAGGECFNLAISKGHADEFVKFADWADSIGIKPKTVIFELDAVSLMPSAPSSSMPDFVVNKEAPPSPLVSYISFHALMFSARTVFSPPFNPRYYNSEFDAAVRKTDPYDPMAEHAYNDSLGPFVSEDNIGAIARFRANWPGVKVICYAAPFTPDFNAAIERKGTLESFTRAMWEISKRCNSFRDFNIPSDLSNNRHLTYDGIHYTPETNDRLAAVMAGNGDLPWSDVSGLSPDQYTRVYRDALARLEGKSEKSVSEQK